MDLESAAREFKMLASKERLSPSELGRAKDLMVELKRLGMTNLEIAELTGGRWSESAVKGYTRGVQTTDPEPWESTTALFSEMLSRNLSLANVSQAMTITTELEAMGSSLGEVVAFMQDIKDRETTLSQLGEAMNLNDELQRLGTSPTEIANFIGELKQENIDTPAFVLLLRDWHEAELTPVDAQSALNYRKQLQGAGFDLEALPQVAEAAGKFGSPAEVLEAVAKYGNLVKLDEEAKTRREKLDKELKTKREELETLAAEMETHSQELDATGHKLEEIRNKTVAMEEALATYGRLEAIGFDEKALGELTKAAEKYGTPRKVLTALNSFGNLSEIKAATEETQGKEKQQRAILKDLVEKHSHLKSAIEMCQQLLRDKFGFDAITTILATAKMYGNPIQVLKAVESYGKRKAMDEEARQLEARIEQLKETESQYESRNKAILEQFEELNVRAIELGRTLGSIEEQLKQSTRVRDILNLLQNPVAAGYEEYAPLVLLLVWSVKIWVNENKSRFSLSYRIDEGLEALAKNLGGS